MGFLKKKRQKVIENIDVYSKHVWLRLSIVIALILLGVGLLTYSLFSLFSMDKGWRVIELDENCYMLSSELQLNYNLGASGAGAVVEYKKITPLYSEAAYKAYRAFNAYEEFDGIANLATLSKKVNCEVKIDPLLYDAIKLLQDNGSRHLYYAPLYAENASICDSDDDFYASELDPRLSEEAATYFEEVLQFVKSDEHIKLELLKDYKVKLYISKEYKSFIDKYKIGALVDFHWLKNAFIVDYIADELISAGYTFGYVTSYNGFFRNLSESVVPFSFNMYSKNGNDIYRGATVDAKNSAMVSLRSFPLTSIYSADGYTYYYYEDGRVVSPYISYEDGYDRAAVDSIFGVSDTRSCAEIAIKLYKYYSSDELDVSGVNSLKKDGINSAWIDGVKISYNDDSLKPAEICTYDEFKFTAEAVK